jgi:hypothetical protein
MDWNLFIDDERNPKDITWCNSINRYDYLNCEWLIARNWDEVYSLIDTLGFPSIISFDHDLGAGEITGYEIAQKLCDMIMNGVTLPKNFEFRIHSKNPVGAENIRQYINNFLKHIGK